MDVIGRWFLNYLKSYRGLLKSLYIQRKGPLDFTFLFIILEAFSITSRQFYTAKFPRALAQNVPVYQTTFFIFFIRVFRYCE